MNPCSRDGRSVRPRTWLVVATMAVVAGAVATAWAADPLPLASLRQDFVDPPALWKSRPLWFWNGPLDQGTTAQIMEASVDSGYYGFGILPTKEMGVPFMSPEFLGHYRHAVDTAARLGLKMCLYDEFWFPSGSAGGLLKEHYPEALSKRLDLVEVTINGSALVDLETPAGELMAAVAMHTDTKERVDLTAQVQQGRLSWKAPAGTWRVMLFTCVPDGAGGLVDYLDPAAVRKFATLTYDKYFETFPEHFGKTIDSAFYDEPTFHWIQGGRAWTPGFNQRFAEKYGCSPVLDYPALWYDIGPDTAAARNRMFGLRAELFSDGFVKTLADWCRAHGIQLTGHVDQEEVVNPVGLCGDLIKAFEHQSIPGLDQIFAYDRGAHMYKVVTSAAVNYGHRLVMTECYGAMDLPVPNLYREAMDQFVKGVNLMVPHAVWYRTNPIFFPPELSYRTEPYASELPRYNQYIARLQRILQQGRPVVDIAVLYPIHGLQSAYYFGPGEPYQGGVIPSWADYMDVGERLSLELRHDFTYLHPETLDARCQVVSGQLEFQQPECPQQYRVLILPGMEAISATNLAKIRAYFDQGGQVIATTLLPDRSAEQGQSDAVRSDIHAIFGTEATDLSLAPARAPQISASSQWQSGGHDAAMACDGDPATRWNAQDQQSADQWLEVDFGAPRTFEKAAISEVFDRVTSHRLEYWDGQQWSVCAAGAEIGAHRTHAFAPVTASRVRLCLPQVRSDTPSISELAILDADGTNLAARTARITVHRNAEGGSAWFIENPTTPALRQVMEETLPLGDVIWKDPPAVRGGHLCYLHKIVEGRHVWFFTNSSATPVSTIVELRGEHVLERWDPHSGRIETCPTTTSNGRTTVPLQLAPVTSLFLVTGS
ncbi:MAG: glycosyl hydrolase [Pirellulaceae bacterium]